MGVAGTVARRPFFFSGIFSRRNRSIRARAECRRARASPRRRSGIAEAIAARENSAPMLANLAGARRIEK
jgi:hypothetical protein